MPLTRPPELRSPADPDAPPDRDDELLGALIGPGARDRTRGRALLEQLSLTALARLDTGGLQAAGLTRAQARRLALAFELGRRVEAHRPPARASLRHPAEVAACMTPLLRGLEQETFHALLLDARHRLLRRVPVSVGTLTASMVHPREVFREAIRRCAAAVVVVHNHPSGDPEPSEEDRAVTRRLIEAGELVGVPLLDHVVIGEGAWVSLRERMGFPGDGRASASR